MDVFLDHDIVATRGLTAALYLAVRRAIDDGRLRAGDPVPSSRELAAQLSLSRHTITTAYGRLVAEGYLEGSAGGGTRVTAWGAAAGATSVPTSASLGTPRAADAPASTGPSSRWWLRVGAPDPALFPLVDWRRRTARALRADTPLLRPPPSTTADEVPGAESSGLPALRTEIARWVERSRGVPATADRVIVTAGAQQAFDLAICALTAPGDVVAVEDPGYPPLRDLVLARHRRIAPVPVDADGIVVDAIPAEARLIHVTPSHQFPLGGVLSLPRRIALLRRAAATGAIVLEDDYDSEHRIDDRPLEPVARLDHGAHCVYVGTFSKVLAPALRLGFVVAPAGWRDELHRHRDLLDHGCPTATQATLAGFLADGAMDRHLHRVRRIYATRHRLVRAWADDVGATWGRLLPAAAGLHLALEVADAGIEADLVAAALAADVSIEGCASYRIASARTAVLLGFGAISTSDLTDALAAIPVGGAGPRR